MILGLFKVSGHSMMPSFNPDDKVIASSIPYFFSNPKIDDVIVFRYNGKMMVKRIRKVSGGQFFVEGDNEKDSLRIGPINRRDILGKVICVIPHLMRDPGLFIV